MHTYKREVLKIGKRIRKSKIGRSFERQDGYVHVHTYEGIPRSVSLVAGRHAKLDLNSDGTAIGFYS